MSRRLPAPPRRACGWDCAAAPGSEAPGPHSLPPGSGPRACRSSCDARHGPSPAPRRSGPPTRAPRPGTAPSPQEISLRRVSPMSRHRCRLSADTGHRTRTVTPSTATPVPRMTTAHYPVLSSAVRVGQGISCVGRVAVASVGRPGSGDPPWHRRWIAEPPVSGVGAVGRLFIEVLRRD